MSGKDTIERAERDEPNTIEIRQCGSMYQVLDGGLLLATFQDIHAAMLHALLAGRAPGNLIVYSATSTLQ